MKPARAVIFSKLMFVVTFLSSSALHAQTDTPQPTLKTSPTQIVDTLNGVFGRHKERAIHAKGILLEGSFTPALSASSVTAAPHFQKKSSPAIVRFSDFAGIPDIPDTHPLGSPRGLAVRFKLPNGTTTDIVTHSFNGFPSSDSDQFQDLLQALAASGPDASKPTALDKYLESHATAKAFLTTPKPPPVSFATLPYFGVNALKFTNAAGKVTFGRYRIVPLAKPEYLTEDQAKNAAPSYLATEIAARVSREPVSFKLLLQVAEKDDKLNDPSSIWPDDRKVVELGTLTIKRVAADQVGGQKAIVFMPNSLPKGIEVQDQMLNFRSSAYAVSFGRRQ